MDKWVITHPTCPFATPRLTIHYLIVVALSIGKPIGSKYSGIETSVQHQTIKASAFILMVIHHHTQGCSWCGAVFGHFQHCTLWCGLGKTITALHFIFAVTCAVRCGAVRCGLELAKTITALRLIFVVTCAVRCITYGLKLIYFLDFGLFLPSKKLIFPFIFGPSLKILNQFIFILGWLS